MGVAPAPNPAPLEEAAPIRESSLLGRRLNAVLLLALALLVAGLIAFKSSYFNQVAITTMIFVILAASLNLITGSAGLLSLGHAAFFGVGAYTAALLSTKFGWPFWLTLPASGAAAALVGAVVAVPTMRLTSIYFAVATLGIVSKYAGGGFAAPPARRSPAAADATITPRGET